jgi:hypothetical protein
MKVRELIKILLQEFQLDDEIAYSLWSDHDIDMLIEDNDDYEGVKLTQEERLSAIALMHKWQDNGRDLSWDNLKFAIAEVLSRRSS